MRVTLAQIRVFANQPERNYRTIKRIVESYQDETDLIVFPELTLSGSILGDRFFDPDFCEELQRYNELIKGLSRDVAIIWGNIYQEKDKTYNAAYFAFGAQWVSHENGMDDGFYLKHLLPNYDVFEEPRYFSPGYGEFSPFIFKEQRIGVQVCEDLWDEGYPISPTESSLDHGVDLLINISSSPWSRGKEDLRYQAIRNHYLEVPFVYVNHVGILNTGKNVLTFDGGSMIVGTDAILKMDAGFEEDIETVDVFSFTSYESETEDKDYKALLHALRYFDEELFSFKPNWLVGLSGGLDSSVSAALLVAALGKERVIGVNMPSRFNHETTKSNAYILAERLGIPCLDLPIEDQVTATLTSLKKAGFEKVEGLAYENMQARLRGHTLMSLASLTNGVVINNGNKLEVALGYATMYGDAIGALAILGDMTKLELSELASYINRDREIIPENLIAQVGEGSITWGFAPSAELKTDQKDPMKWGYHDVLIPYLLEHSLIDFMKSYASKAIFKTRLGDLMKFYGLDDPRLFIEDLEWVLAMMSGSVYKRIQMPPIVRISAKAYGSSYRESQLPLLKTKAYQDMKELILAEAK